MAVPALKDPGQEDPLIFLKHQVPVPVRFSEAWTYSSAEKRSPAVVVQAEAIDKSSWPGVGDEETPFEQSKSAGVSQIGSPRTDSSAEKVQPCKICILVLRNILHLTEEQGTNSGQKANTCGAHGKQFCFTADIQQHQKQHTRETLLQYIMGKLSFLKSCTIHASGSLSPYNEIGKEFVANLGVQPQAKNTRNQQNNKDKELRETSVTAQRSWKLGNMKEASNTESISHWPGFTIIATERVEMEDRVKSRRSSPGPG
ncbi:hypothetical protein E5288_WYG007414 [Bos mutus]|uniref:C2H2-type domain-containing protein n=1 Tax=Bos mutus TaxID=72004 RepID=A0A6B0SAG9_9CETA|nr:hypothetical protein [Bos mutus]